MHVGHLSTQASKIARIGMAENVTAAGVEGTVDGRR
jgi:hypothetical protein